MGKKVKSFSESYEITLNTSIQKFLEENPKISVLSLSHASVAKRWRKDYTDYFNVDEFKFTAILIYEEVEEEKDIIHG